MTDPTAADAEPTDLKSALIELRHAREEISRLRPFVDRVDQAQRDDDAAAPSAPAEADLRDRVIKAVTDLHEQGGVYALDEPEIGRITDAVLADLPDRIAQALAAVLAECDAIEADYRDQHDEVAVGTRAAIIRIRARVAVLEQQPADRAAGPFVPPAADGLPLAALDSATNGASALDAWARDARGRNFLAHALVQLARDGWLRIEPGEEFEAVRDRETPEPSVPADADPRERIAQTLAEHVGWKWAPGFREQSPTWHDFQKEADAVLAVLPALADRGALPSSFVLWLDASDGSAPSHDGIVWPDGTATVHHRHFGYTTTHSDPEVARQSAHGKQGRIVWPETAPTDRVAFLREAADVCDEAGAVYTSKALNEHAGAAFTLMERFLRKANEAEYVAAPCSVGGCEPGGEPCTTHERLMAHGEGDHELCEPDCANSPRQIPGTDED